MGCCFSAGNRHREAESGSSKDGAPPTSPPVVFDEEAVKEVLMDTSIVVKIDEKVAGKGEIEPAAAIRGNSGQLKKDKEEIASEFSEISEICSFSESLSAQLEKEKEEEEDGVVNQRPPPRKRRANSGGRGRGRGERGMGRRVAPPAPEKRVAPLRPARGRGVAAPPRNVAEGNEKEDVVKRSRSPARFPVTEAPVDEKIPVPAKGELGNDVVPGEEPETLENPVVSLECFIFL